MTLLERLNPNNGPKRILALDGGGIRGALTLGYLQRIEDILRRQNGNNPNFTLSDYFDLIGGTSTGSIIASCLALGMEVKDIKEKYFELGGRIFGKKYNWWNIFQIDDIIKAKYDAEPLENELQKVFGDITLGSDTIKTGLCIVTKRADTNSVWPLINHPEGKYYDSEVGTNKDILLWKAVRASAAAPTYFIPQVINVGGGLPTAAFVDGGVSMANNPAFQLLMVATLKGFPFHWKMGAENLLLVSVGTGMSKLDRLPVDVSKNNLLNWAQQIPDMLMQDASWQNQLILQWLSKSPTAQEIDGEIGKLEEDLLVIDATNNEGLLSYLRYNFLLDEKIINDLKPKGKSFTKKQVDDLIEMSNAASRFDLYDIGETAAEDQVLDSHFPQTFNPLKYAKKVFISYDHSEDKLYKELLRAWDANTNFDFEFDQRSPNDPINSSNAATIKQSLTRMMKDAEYLLVIVGKKSHESKWMEWEIDRAKESDVKLKLAAVKIDNSYTTPAGLLNTATAFAKSFTKDGIINALDNANNNY